MNYALILAAGVGQRMRSGGLPKQFLKLLGKPIIIYTLEKFEDCPEVDKVIVVCHGAYTELMNDLIVLYKLKKIHKVVVGGKDRKTSLELGLQAVFDDSKTDDDIVIIHDGVRPLVLENTIRENIRVAQKSGCAITVRSVSESVVITDSEEAEMKDFQKRDDTYSLTSPQTFRIKEIKKINEGAAENANMPLLDAAMIYASQGGKVSLVKEQNNNIKVTTPEDFYFLKAMLEMEENRRVFGL